MNVLTMISEKSVQSYIFRSNRLKEVVGASWLAASALEEWRASSAGRKLLYAGGGNAAIVFASIDQARREIEEWSRRWFQEAPALAFSVVHRPYDEGLAYALLDAREGLLPRQEDQESIGAPFGALSVVRSCPSTGLAAGWPPVDGEYLGEEARAKALRSRSATSRLEQSCSLPEGYTFPERLDELGITEGSSHLAIVHADGDEMGSLLYQHVDKYDGQDEAAIAALADISDRISNAGRVALTRVIEAVLRLVTKPSDELERWALRPIPNEKGQILLPIRPVVFGGDDVTFICHARLALYLARLYLTEFEAEGRNQKLGTVTASAGVFMGPAKFPFARGYEFADQLCRLAKDRRKSAGKRGSWLDFHIQLEGATEDIPSQRKRISEDLFARPYCVSAAWENLGVAATWPQFQSRLRSLRNTEHWPRNKVKALREALLRGGTQIDCVAELLGENSGFDKGQMPLWFDAVDAFDFCIDEELFFAPHT